MTRKPNYILITMDEVRPDHLSCYGYKRISTPNLDKIAQEGLVFEEVVSTSCLTPTSHASILTGLYPQRHGLRTPFDKLKGKLIQEYMKENGYQTAGFAGVNLTGAKTGFSLGFDYFEEPTEETAWRKTIYKKNGFKYLKKTEKIDRINKKSLVLWGHDWTQKMFRWIRENYKNPFFIWGHYFECHEGAENSLLEQNKIKKGFLEEFCYYDAKIQFMDLYLFEGLLGLLQKLKLEKITYLIITSDHGTNLGEHPIPFKKEKGVTFPQHVTLYDCDLKVPLIIKGPKIPRNKRVKGMVRSIDITPTLLELRKIKAGSFDGISLLSFIKQGKAENLTAYAEELFHLRGPGDFQAIRNNEYKLILDRRNIKEEFYNLRNDPNEKKNIISKLSYPEKQIVREWRMNCNKAFNF